MSSMDEKWKKVYKRNETIVSRKIADEMLLVPVRGHVADMQRIFALTPVAEYIWERLDGKQDLENMRDGLLDVFDVETEQANADLFDFVEELLEAGLIFEAE